MRRKHTMATLLAGVAVDVWVAALACQAQPARDAPAFIGFDYVSVSGARLLRDGRPWTPHGLGLVAFEAGPGVLHAHPTFQAAFQHYSPIEFVQIREWGADSVRMQVAQPAVDPASSQFDPQFRETVVGAVRAARSVGLIVILSMQDEPQSGEPRRDPDFLPTASTVSAWRNLAPEFNGDRGVLYEIFNEPRIGPGAGENPVHPTAEHWRRWSSAMGTVIGAVRATGSQNVIVVDGFAAAQTLAYAPAFGGSAGPVAYAVHPYFETRVMNNPDGWTSRFGAFAQDRPVLVTEWNTAVGLTCGPQTPQLALQFLGYLKAREIGVEPYAYDFVQPGFGAIVSAFGGWRPNPPTTFVGQGCPRTAGVPVGTPDFGAGATVQSWYRSGSLPDRPL